MPKHLVWLAASLTQAALLLASSQPVRAFEPGDKPAFIVGDVVATHYDGTSNDLLTAGLGASGLGSATPPPVSNPPSAEELRRLAIWSNYRALIDPTPGGGYGLLYGPTATADGEVRNPQGTIPGWEALAFARDDGRGNDPAATITVMVQIPDGYDPAHGCIITAPSSGSRGIYGAIATAGEWGLKHDCAVAYTDKGTGTGAHDLHNDTVNLLRGDRADAKTAGAESNFTARLTEEQRTAFDATHPYRFAFKHPHSQVNPEADWGRDVLQGIEFAFYVLNLKLSPGQPHAINKRNTLVIASSVSNGGGASLRAAEQDEHHLIDGVAVSEPNVNPVFKRGFTIQQGNGNKLVRHSRPLEDYATFENLYIGCAAVIQKAAPLNNAASPARCDALHAAGLLRSETPEDQAAEAQKILNDYGLLPEQNVVAPSYWFSYVYQAIAVTYTNQYGRFSVLDDLCGYSMGATVPVTGEPTPLAATAEASLFGTSNGIPPTAGVNLINDLAPGGPKEDRVSTPDQDLRGALCLRALATGKETAASPTDGALAAQARRVAHGVREVLATGDLHGVPAVYVVGRSDANLPPNFTGRAYYGLNQLVEGSRSQLRYYEVTNAHHLDVLNQYPGFDSTMVPLHHYFVQAMNLMYAHLREGAPLPPSQVVHTVPRGTGPSGVPPITEANVPPIAANPASQARIVFEDGTLRIPD